MARRVLLAAILITTVFEGRAWATAAEPRVYAQATISNLAPTTATVPPATVIARQQTTIAALQTTTARQERAATSAPVRRLTPTATPPATESVVPAGIPRDAAAATVADPIDGDKLRVRRPGQTMTDEVRLINADAPEVRNDDGFPECYGPEAAARLKRMLPKGRRVWLERDRKDKDHKDRLWRYVWFVGQRDGKAYLANDLMLREGFASFAADDENTARAEALQRAEDAAKGKNAALWKACGAGHVAITPTPAPPPPTSVPAPTADAAPTEASATETAGTCAGANDWATATLPRLNRATEILGSFKDLSLADPGLADTLVADADEFAGLAADQRATTTPPSFQRTNDLLADAFDGYADAYRLASQAITDVSPDELQQATAKIQAANATQQRSLAAFNAAKRECGLATGRPALVSS